MATDKLRNEVIKAEYVDRVTKEMENKEESNNINAIWDNITDSLKTGAIQVLGYEKKSKWKAWFDDECEEINKSKREARIEWLRTNEQEHLNDYREKRKAACKLYKQKKNEWIDDKMREIEFSSMNNNVRSFYRQIKQTKKTYTIRNRGMKNENGILENRSEKIKKIWENHFQKLLNTSQNEEIEQDEAEDTSIEDEIEEPTNEEIIEAIKQLKNRKTPGTDEIIAEMIKNGGEKIQAEICKLIKQIWIQEKMPDKWKEGVIVTIKKKEAQKNVTTIEV